jgi:hypothetical protein
MRTSSNKQSMECSNICLMKPLMLTKRPCYKCPTQPLKLLKPKRNFKLSSNKCNSRCTFSKLKWPSTKPRTIKNKLVLALSTGAVKISIRPSFQLSIKRQDSSVSTNNSPKVTKAEVTKAEDAKAVDTKDEDVKVVDLLVVVTRVVDVGNQDEAMLLNNATPPFVVGLMEAVDMLAPAVKRRSQGTNLMPRLRIKWEAARIVATDLWGPRPAIMQLKQKKKSLITVHSLPTHLKK